MRESDVEAHLVQRVKAQGGETRKVEWIGRSSAPDQLVMLPGGITLWVEVKNPDTVLTFPANAHERAQAREHARMRALGQRVEVVGTKGQVDALLDAP